MKNLEIKGTPKVPETEFSARFVQGMADRMAVSFFKYGAAPEAYPSKVDAIASLRIRLDKYAATGNTEFLIDAANFAMLEFMYPRHEKAFFAPTDSDQSPGRAWNGGTVTQHANTESRERMRLGGSGSFHQHDGD